MAINDFINLVCRSSQQRCFFHFTDAANEASIRTHGLLSMRELQDRGISMTPGGNDLSHQLDRQLGMDRYVHLCFRQTHGMAHVAAADGRIAKTRWLSVLPKVLSLPDICVTLGNAVKNDIAVLRLADAIDQMDIEVLYCRTDWNDPAIRERLRAVERYELLIPNHVPPTYIR